MVYIDEALTVLSAPAELRPHKKTLKEGKSSSNKSSVHSQSSSSSSKQPDNSESRRMSAYFNMPITIVTTGVSASDEELINQFVDIFNITRVHNGFQNIVTAGSQENPTVTHLIVPVDENGVFQQRTMKYMQALMAGAWVVNMAWIADSLSRGCILAETEYEVNNCYKATVEFSPKRARIHVFKVTIRIPFV